VYRYVGQSTNVSAQTAKAISAFHADARIRNLGNVLCGGQRQLLYYKDSCRKEGDVELLRIYKGKRLWSIVPTLIVALVI
jgi:hypothetical protein